MPTMRRTANATTTTTSSNSKPRGTYLIQTSPPYIHCNSQCEFHVPPPIDYSYHNHKDKHNHNGTNNGPSNGNHIKNPSTTTVEKNSTKHPNRVLLSPCPSSTDNLSPAPSLPVSERSQWPPSQPAKEINRSLNLCLGLPFDPRKVGLIRSICRVLSDLLALVERPLFCGWDKVPLRLRQKLVLIGWAIYFPIHRLVFSNRTGVHQDVSYEYHAITTIMYWGRLFPTSIRRIRFCLSQLAANHHPTVYPPTVRKGSVDTYGGTGDALKEEKEEEEENDKMMEETKRSTSRPIYERDKSVQKAPPVSGMVAHEIFEILYCGESEKDNASSKPLVTGYYIQHGDVPSKRVMLYLYGGAFLGGDAKGNLNFAEKIGQRCRYTDVFIPTYRLIPEYLFVDALHDVTVAYKYLVTVLDVAPENVVVFGVSSGGGLAVRLLQSITERRMRLEGCVGIDVKEEEEDKNSGGNGVCDESGSSVREQKETDIDDPRLTIMPAGAVLMCPFVDYTEPKGSFVEYIAHDLVVNEGVFEEGVPYFATAGDAQKRRDISPVYRTFSGLPPLCVLVSEHEAVYDQVKELVNRARAAGVKVDVGLWKYLCHVWPMFTAFIPEARSAVDFACNWINDH